VPDLLRVLQHGDSFFPSGGVAFSLGLETLKEDGVVKDAVGIERLITSHLRQRWASTDRSFVANAHRAKDLDEARGLDSLLDAMTLPRELREGSRRNGGALLRVMAALGGSHAAGYRELVLAERAPGHLAVVQGLVYSERGLSIDESLAVAGHGLVVGMLAAALRLGMIGHVAAQASLTRLHDVLAEILGSPLLGINEVHAFTPLAEIAVMRHEAGDSRLFAN